MPLAWLIRVEDWPQYRAWLNLIADDLLAHQDACGAIQEQISVAAASNEDYGTGEALSASAERRPRRRRALRVELCPRGPERGRGGDPRCKTRPRRPDKLAKFLVRIQTRSGAHPDLDGAWYRCFDFKRWDYWASNADSGWGGWCTETGWSREAWIITGLVMRQSKTSLWELTAKSKIATRSEKYRKLMIP